MREKFLIIKILALGLTLLLSASCGEKKDADGQNAARPKAARQVKLISAV